MSPVRWSALLGSVAVLVWSVPGIIMNPDFGVGDAASSVRVLGVDMNGWHALSGFAVAIPGLYAARRDDWSAVFVPLAAAALIATGIWALFDTRPAAGLFDFPNNGADAILHFATSAIFLAGAAHRYLLGGGATTAARPARPSP